MTEMEPFEIDQLLDNCLIGRLCMADRTTQVAMLPRLIE